MILTLAQSTQNLLIRLTGALLVSLIAWSTSCVLIWAVNEVVMVYHPVLALVLTVI